MMTLSEQVAEVMRRFGGRADYEVDAVIDVVAEWIALQAAFPHKGTPADGFAVLARLAVESPAPVDARTPTQREADELRIRLRTSFSGYDPTTYNTEEH